MALLMTVFFENGFSENYFPNVDNRNFPIAIRPYVSGLKDELILNVEVQIPFFIRFFHDFITQKIIIWIVHFHKGLRWFFL